MTPAPVAPAPVATAGGGRIPPPPAPPVIPATPAAPSNSAPKATIKPKQPQQQRTSGRTANQNYRDQVSAQAATAAARAPQPAQPRGPDMISKIAAAPVNALTKGIGAYSRIVNAPRALGQALKSAAGGAPQQLQRQIAGTARRGGITAAADPVATDTVPVQQNAGRAEELIQRIRKNPNDQQAITALRSLKS